MSKRVLSLFSGCGGMDLGLEGDFWIHKTCINEIINPDWIVDKNENQVKLKKTSLETVFANDINLGAKNEDFDLAQKSYSKAKYLPKGQGQIEVDLQGLSPTIRAEHHGNIEDLSINYNFGTVK